MYDIQENISLKEYNTFGLEANARYFCEINSKEDLIKLISSDLFKKSKYLILGGGSNILLTSDYDGLVIKNNICGQEIIEENEAFVKIRSYSGNVWHKLVIYCVNNGWGGIENLSLIPGSVGAAPMQNIGAYGVELKNVFESLEAIELSTGKLKTFSKADCKFEYRQSIFKNKLKDKFFIYSINLKLSKSPDINTSYGAIKDTLKEMKISDPGIKDVSNAVISIRRSKLPDPIVLGNSGSFFKNPIIENDFYNKIKKTYPNIVGYPNGETHTKVAAGWLIEQCGFKGKRVGNTGSHKDQALVLVNYGNAKGEEIWSLAKNIKKSVKETFGIDIDPEVNII